MSGNKQGLPPTGAETDAEFARLRQQMVVKQLKWRGIRDARVLAAIEEVPRHAFVPAGVTHLAYRDCPLPIGLEQTISQPYTVAFMSEALRLRGTEKVLEIGTGSGYGAAVLSRLASEVYTVERLPELADTARQRLERLGYDNVQFALGDGSLGWPEAAPFDAVIVTAAAVELPGPLQEQLSDGGRIVIPLGPRSHSQVMHRFTLVHGSWHDESLGGFAFVPLIGQHGTASSEEPTSC